MSLDFTTLFLFTLDVEAMLGLLLLFSWAQNTGVTAVAWWGAANLLRALSIGLYGMYGALPDFLTITVADVILFSSYAVTWTGARVFHGRPARPGSLVTGATVWLLACQLAALIIGLPFGLFGVATAYAIVMFGLFVPALVYAGRPFGIGGDR